MASDLEYVVGDVGGTVTITCEDSAGTPVDLTGATAALLVEAAYASGAYKVDAAAAIDPDQVDNIGQAHYIWQAGDLNTPGLYLLRVRVTWGDGTVRAFPAEGLTLEVFPA